jgi:hypothetical protein
MGADMRSLNNAVRGPPPEVTQESGPSASLSPLKISPGTRLAASCPRSQTQALCQQLFNHCRPPITGNPEHFDTPHSVVERLCGSRAVAENLEPTAPSARNIAPYSRPAARNRLPEYRSISAGSPYPHRGFGYGSGGGTRTHDTRINRSLGGLVRSKGFRRFRKSHKRSRHSLLRTVSPPFVLSRGPHADRVAAGSRFAPM